MIGRALLLAAALIAFTAAIPFAGVIPLQLVAPGTDHVGPGCPDIDPDDPDGAYRVGPATTDLKEIWLRAIRFDVPGDTVTIGRIPTSPRGGDTIRFDFEVEDGIQGELLPYAVDLGGHVSCRGASLVFAIPARDTGRPGLLAEYFDDMALAFPFQSRVDPTIDFDWNESEPLPGMDPDEFSIRWTGSIRTSGGGGYRFRARVEDAVRLWIGTTQVLDSWAPASEHDVIGTITLQAGAAYPIKVEYFARWGTAACRLFWTPPGEPEQLVPTAAFSH